MTEKDTVWNRFIEEICDRDAEMENGGHSGYLDCYPETNPDELEDALLTVGNREMADNCRKAITVGEEDDF